MGIFDKVGDLHWVKLVGSACSGVGIGKSASGQARIQE